jgi:hypothetical protein
VVDLQGRACKIVDCTYRRNYDIKHMSSRYLLFFCQSSHGGDSKTWCRAIRILKLSNGYEILLWCSGPLYCCAGLALANCLQQ